MSTAAAIGISDFSGSGLPLCRLPGAEAEADEVSDFCSTNGMMVQDIRGATAGLPCVLDALARTNSLIHIATHGLLEQMALALHESLLPCEQLMSLKLAAEVVVLSACNTAGGHVGADGVIGFARAFMAAGVPSTVVSLGAFQTGAPVIS